MTEKLTNEQAVKEVQKFVEKYDDKKKEDWEIENDYPHVIEALKLGLLSFQYLCYSSFLLVHMER